MTRKRKCSPFPEVQRAFFHIAGLRIPFAPGYCHNCYNGYCHNCHNCHNGYCHNCDVDDDHCDHCDEIVIVIMMMTMRTMMMITIMAYTQNSYGGYSYSKILWISSSSTTSSC